MFNIIIFSDDQPLLNLLEEIANDIIDTNVSKANLDSEVGKIIQNASANSILIFGVTKSHNKSLFEIIKDSIFGISSLFISTSNPKASFDIAKKLNADSLFIGETNNLEIKYAIERLTKTFARNQWKIIDGKKVIFINKNMIEWIKTQGNYSSICHNGKITIVRKPLKQIEEELESLNLTKIHRSALVNTSYISEVKVSDSEVVMRDNQALPIGRSFKKSIAELIS